MIKEMVSEDWIEEAKQLNKSLFSELDVLLKSLDRFFESEDMRETGKNFFPELLAARDAILRVIDILEYVIPADKKNVYWFQKFARAKLLTARKRDVLLEELHRQDTREKSYYLLYDSFINLRSIINELLKNNAISYVSFKNLGQIITKQIRENAFFNPFRHDMDPDLDVIENKEISDIVKGIQNAEEKRIVSIIFLHLFRFMRYLRHMDVMARRYIVLHTSLLILLLLRTEISAFLYYVDSARKKVKNDGLATLLHAFSYQFSMETKRVYNQEIKDVFEKKSPHYIRGRLENGHGILKNLTEQTIVQLARFWKKEMRGESIFESFITRTEQSLKLRDDIFALEKILLFFETARTLNERQRIFNSLRNFMEYFSKFTFKLLRHDDYEAFSSFFEETKTFFREGTDTERFLEKCKHFRVFLNTTLRQIANRSELIDRPLDIERAEKWVKRYL